MHNNHKNNSSRGEDRERLRQAHSEPHDQEENIHSGFGALPILSQAALLKGSSGHGKQEHRSPHDEADVSQGQEGSGSYTPNTAVQGGSYTPNAVMQGQGGSYSYSPNTTAQGQGGSSTLNAGANTAVQGQGGSSTPNTAVQGQGGTSTPNTAVQGQGGTSTPNTAVQGQGGSYNPNAAVQGQGGSYSPHTAVQGQGGSYGQDVGQYTQVQGPETHGIQGQNVNYTNVQGQQSAYYQQAGPGTGADQFNAYGHDPFQAAHTAHQGLSQTVSGGGQPVGGGVQGQSPFLDPTGGLQSQMSQIVTAPLSLSAQAGSSAAVGVSLGLSLPAAAAASYIGVSGNNTLDSTAVIGKLS